MTRPLSGLQPLAGHAVASLCLVSLVSLLLCGGAVAQSGKLNNIGAFCKGAVNGKVPGAWCNEYIDCDAGQVVKCPAKMSFDTNLMDCADEATVWCPYGQRGFWGNMMPSGGLVSIHCSLMPFTSNVVVWQRGGAWWAVKPEPGMEVPGSELLNNQGLQWEQLSALQDPINNKYLAYQADPAFCSGQSHLPDGRLLVCGGDYLNMSGRMGEPRQGIDECRFFKCWDVEQGDLGTCMWELMEERMGTKRWYPTQLLIPPYDGDGHFTVVIGGSAVGQDPEKWGDLYRLIDIVYPNRVSEGKKIMQVDEIPFTVRLGNMNMYPNMFLLPRKSAAGNYQFFIHAINHGEIIEISNPIKALESKTPTNPFKTLEVLPEIKTDKGENVSMTYPSGGCAVMHGLEYPWNVSAKVTYFGGHAGTYNEFLDMDKAFNAASVGLNLAFTMDILKVRKGKKPNPADDAFWQMETMPDNAVLRDCVLLPTGKVALVSGARMGRSKASNNGDGCAKEQLYHPWIYDPRSKVGGRFFQDASVQPTWRAYHSCSILLPDGSIYSAGTETGPAVTEKCDGPRDYHYNVDGYVPMQIYTGILDGTRPTIVENPHHFVLGNEAVIKFTGNVEECSLYKPAAQTHQLNMSLRLVFLRTLQLWPWNPKTPKVPGTIKVMLPKEEEIISSGPTLLYCLWKRRLYTEGVWIHLDPYGTKVEAEPAKGAAAGAGAGAAAGAGAGATVTNDAGK